MDAELGGAGHRYFWTGIGLSGTRPRAAHEGGWPPSLMGSIPQIRSSRNQAVAKIQSGTQDLGLYSFALPTNEAISASSPWLRRVRPSTTPARSRTSRFWLILLLASRRVMVSRRPTIPRAIAAKYVS